jgi:hypothetical protein
MTTDQEGKCAICGSLERRLVIDHDHETGKVRALLCWGCNVGLGYFGDSPEMMMEAIAYVKQYR